MIKRICALVIASCFSFLCCTDQKTKSTVHTNVSTVSNLGIIPIPSSVSSSDNLVDFSQGIYVVPALHSSDIIVQSLNRFIEQMKGLGISTSNAGGLNLTISVREDSPIVLDSSINEDYSLNISRKSISISTKNYVGLNHALSTLTQLLFLNRATNEIPEITINDTPRFNWRGLMIDVSRHFIPKEIILKNLDAMSLVKMNVLHLHLSDDQAWRIESKIFPKLHQLASGGQYYSQDDIREIVTYAKNLGIRVIPEINMPAHVTSWLVGYPRIASVQKEYEVIRTYGVHKNLLDPTLEDTYAFIQLILKEVAEIFPDKMIHIGGNEVVAEQWSSSDKIKLFMQEKDLKDLGQLQAYFLLRVQQIVKGLGKSMMGWQEISRPELDKGHVIVQSWQELEGTNQSAEMGFKTIHSAGWALDHKLSVTDLYKIDPSGLVTSQNIKVDSTNWLAWKIKTTIGTKENTGSILLSGQQGSRKGILHMANRRVVIEDVVLSKDILRFSSNNTTGDVSASLQVMENHDLEGVLTMAGIKILLKGEKIGGHDMPDGMTMPKLMIGNNIDAANESNVIGGEACMWAEWVDKTNINSRIWPRSAAIAEKLWSPREATTKSDYFYQRYEQFKSFLKDIELDYDKTKNNFIAEVSEGVSRRDVETFLNSLEEVKYFGRFSSNMNHSITDPLNSVADKISPESIDSYHLNNKLKKLEEDGLSESIKKSIIEQLDVWIPLYRNLQPVFKEGNPLQSHEVLALALSDLAKIAKHVMESGALTETEAEYYGRLKINAQREIEGVLLAPAKGLITLIDKYRTEI